MRERLVRGGERMRGLVEVGEELERFRTGEEGLGEVGKR